jgi:hypothetical protein
MSITRYRLPARVAVAILRFQLDSCEKQTAEKHLNRGWTRIYADKSLAATPWSAALLARPW